MICLCIDLFEKRKTSNPRLLEMRISDYAFKIPLKSQNEAEVVILELVREIPVKCRIRRNTEFSTLTTTHKNFRYTTTTSTYIIRIKLVINKRYIK